MNVFNKVALQGLKKNRARTVVTVIGVMLSAALFTAVTTFGFSLLNYMIKGAVGMYGSWHVGFWDVEQEFVEQRMQDEETEKGIVIRNIGYAPLENAQNPEVPYFCITGCDKGAFRDLSVTPVSGRLPENNSEAIISAKASTDGGYKISIGDKVTLMVGSRMDGDRKLGYGDEFRHQTETFMPEEKKTYTIVGICRTPSFESAFPAGYALLTRTDDTAGRPSLFIRMKNPLRVRSYADKAAQGHTYKLNNSVLRFMGLSESSGDKIFFSLLCTFGVVVMLIIMVGSVFLIYNSFSISLSERMQQIGMLASVGATTRQLCKSVLFEGLCIGIIGIPFGVLMGIGGCQVVISIVGKDFGNILYTDIPMTLKISGIAIAAAVAVSFLTIEISAYIPAKKAVRIPVMECIRQTNEVKVEAKSMKIPGFMERIYGLEGMLALKNFRRNRKRYRSIVMSLVLSVVLFIVTSSAVESMQRNAQGAIAYTTFDISFSAQDMEDEEMNALYGKLKLAEGVEDSSFQKVMTWFCSVPIDVLSDQMRMEVNLPSNQDEIDLTLRVHVFDDATCLKYLKELGLPEEEYMREDGKVLAVAKVDETFGRLAEAGEFVDMFTCTSIEADISPRKTDGSKSGQEIKAALTMADVEILDIPMSIEATEENLPYIFELIVPYSCKERFELSDSRVDLKGLTFGAEHPAADLKDMQAIIADADIQTAYFLTNVSQMMEESRNYIFIVNVFAYTFIAMISLIAVANVFNTISTNIKLRRRELAMLRSVGMSDRDFNKMMRFECVLYGTRSLFVGIPLALVCSWLLSRLMYTAEDAAYYTIPWDSVGISVVSVLLIIFTTMMYAVSKVKKENIIDALRDEMT